MSRRPGPARRGPRSPRSRRAPAADDSGPASRARPHGPRRRTCGGARGAGPPADCRVGASGPPGTAQPRVGPRGFSAPLGFRNRLGTVAAPAGPTQARNGARSRPCHHLSTLSAGRPGTLDQDTWGRRPDRLCRRYGVRRTERGARVSIPFSPPRRGDVVPGARNRLTRYPGHQGGAQNGSADHGYVSHP